MPTPDPDLPPDRRALLDRWTRGALSHALHPADRAVIEASSSARALVIDLLVTTGAEDELYDACAVLGRLLAELGGSPTLASATIDEAAKAIGAPGAPWVTAARAALAEGFAASVAEAAQRSAVQAWEFPNCAVPLGEAALAVAAGHPSDDDEVLAAWSARIAREAALRGVRRAVVSGGDRACAALIDAMQLVGIDVQRAPLPRRS